MGTDMAMECIGNPETITQAFESVRTGGTVCLVGYSFKSPPLNAARLMYKEIELSGSLAGIIPDYYRVLDMIRKDRFKINKLVTSSYPLDKINEAFNELRRGAAIRITVEM